MLFQATHYQLTEDEHGAIAICIPISCTPQSRSPLEVFAAAGTLKPQRCVNWTQTFARKGLNHEDYVPMQENLHDITFIKKPLAATGLPNRVTFQRTYSKQTVQGDLVVINRELPVIYARQVGRLQQFEVKGEFSKMLSSMVWIVKAGWLEHLLRYCPQDSRSAFEADFIKRFIAGRSLVHLAAV